MSLAERLIGAPVDRIEGREKVAGKAKYAYEYERDDILYAHIVASSVTAGRVVRIDDAEARALPGVVAVVTHENAPRVEAEGELAVLQSDEVAYRGQIVGGVVAESVETARRAAALVRIEYDVAEHDVELRADHPGLYKPDKVNPSFPTDTEDGDPDAALARAAVAIDE